MTQQHLLNLPPYPRGFHLITDRILQAQTFRELLDAAPGWRELIELGHDLFGENRVQEALAKIPEVGPGATWHLIGHLQRNKARHCVGAFELIHGVESGFAVVLEIIGGSVRSTVRAKPSAGWASAPAGAARGSTTVAVPCCSTAFSRWGIASRYCSFLLSTTPMLYDAAAPPSLDK